MSLEPKTIELLNTFKGIYKIGVEFYLPTMLLQLTIDGNMTEYDSEEDMVKYINTLSKEKK